MQQTIDIRVKATGQRVDIYPNETIEVNMGGISLLNLADRTVSYTNSFKIPRTPNNERLFEFASQPTRSNRPSVEVVITKGLFQKNATLKVKEFDGDYKCEVVYDSVIDKITNTNIYDIIPDNKTIDVKYGVIPATIKEKATIDRNRTKETFKPALYGNNKVLNEPSAIYITKLFNFFTTETGVEITGNLLADSDFKKLALVLSGDILYRTFDEVEDGGTYTLTTTQIVNKTSDSQIAFNKLLKQLCLLFFCNFKVDKNKIELNKITLGEGLYIETLSGTKTLYSNYGNKNYIKYKKKDETIGNSYSDVFIADGIGSKDALELELIAPKYFNDTTMAGYDCINNIDTNEIIFLAVSSNATIRDCYFEQVLIQNVSCYDASLLALAPFYSSILNPIFANPVILSASGYIDPLTADSIMNTRIINSVKLGGRYWVDEMKYNLTTGNSVLKLIKLP